VFTVISLYITSCSTTAPPRRLPMADDLCMSSIYYFFFFFFSYVCREPQLVSHKTASSSAECSRDKLPFSFVRGQDSTMWNIVWVSPERHKSVSISHHFLLQALQCPCSVRKRFSRDHCSEGGRNPVAGLSGHTPGEN